MYGNLSATILAIVRYLTNSGIQVLLQNGFE